MNIERTIEKIKERLELNKHLKAIEGNIIGISVEDAKTLLTAYEKEKEDNKRLRKCHLQYEEMTGIDLLLPEKEE